MLNHNFLSFAKLKFSKGAQEHGQKWSQVDHRKELLDECYDGYNYANGAAVYNDKETCKKIQWLLISAWQLAKDLQTNPAITQEKGRVLKSINEIDERLFYRTMDEYFKADQDNTSRSLLEVPMLNIVRKYNEKIKGQDVTQSKA